MIHWDCSRKGEGNFDEIISYYLHSSDLLSEFKYFFCILFHALFNCEEKWKETIGLTCIIASKDRIHYLNFQFKSEMNVLDLICEKLLESS